MCGDVRGRLPDHNWIGDRDWLGVVAGAGWLFLKSLTNRSPTLAVVSLMPFLFWEASLRRLAPPTWCTSEPDHLRSLMLPSVLCSAGHWWSSWTSRMPRTPRSRPGAPVAPVAPQVPRVGDLRPDQSGVSESVGPSPGSPGHRPLVWKRLAGMSREKGLPRSEWENGS